MMKSMMPKMMGSMMGGKGSMMANMMGMMMSGSETDQQQEKPWDMCKKMMSNMSKTADMAAFATPEIRSLFEEWARQIEEEILAFIQEKNTTNPADLAAHFKLSQDSVNYFLTRLAAQGKVNLKAEKKAKG